MHRVDEQPFLSNKSIIVGPDLARRLLSAS